MKSPVELTGDFLIGGDRHERMSLTPDVLNKR
jgi:hypothetical protein